jgi:uncharacterized membrane protein YdcZ (DUF606 family)
MRFVLLLPVVLGAVMVLQGAFNKQIMAHWGLGSVVVFNSVFVLLFSLFYMVVAWGAPQLLPGDLGNGGQLSQVRWWWLLPPVCGMAIITLMPVAIQRLGALKVFVVVVAAQMVVSMIWDGLVEGQGPTAGRVVGAALVAVGVVVASLG